MKVAKEEIPARIESPDAVGRHQPDFGDATDYGNIAAENFTPHEEPISLHSSKGWKTISASHPTGDTL